jgi:hypothetical protein
MNEKSNVQNMMKETSSFFNMHWNKDAIKSDPPKWEKWKKENDIFINSIPYLENGGCYALLKGEEIIYIGSGVSRGYERYINRGISNRLISHVVKSHNRVGWVPRDNWSHITDIYTIGFGEEIASIALALERHLIRALLPMENRSHK